jgi:uridine kinase
MKIINYILDVIQSVKGKKPILVAFDGIDTSGKTTLADKVYEMMVKKKLFAPVRISIDKFHNPREVRLRRGELSPEGFFYDSFNYRCVIDHVILPVKNKHEYIIGGVFDYLTEKKLLENKIRVTDETVVLFDGIFMNRDELYKYWDISIFLEISYQTAIKRALSRDLKLFGTEEEIIRKYQNRYLPGESIYLETCKPKERSGIVIDNNDYNNPKFIRKWNGGI